MGLAGEIAELVYDDVSSKPKSSLMSRLFRGLTMAAQQMELFGYFVLLGLVSGAAYDGLRAIRGDKSSAASSRGGGGHSGRLRFYRGGLSAELWPFLAV